MNLEIEQQLEENKTLFKDILDGETMELTRKNIQKATPNGINVVNNGRPPYIFKSCSVYLPYYLLSL